MNKILRAIFNIFTSKETNSTLVETIDDHNWRLGKKFTFYFAKRDLGLLEQINLALVVGDHNIVIDEIALAATSAIMSWEWYTNSEVDESTGAPVYEIPMNKTIQSLSGAKLLVNPTIITLGTSPLAEHVTVLGIPAGGSYRLYEKLISKTPIAILKNTTNILRITNHDGTKPHMGFVISYHKM